MTEAFKCEGCVLRAQLTTDPQKIDVDTSIDPYHDGSPEMELYRKEHIDRQGTDEIKVMDLCEDCAELIAS